MRLLKLCLFASLGVALGFTSCKTNEMEQPAPSLELGNKTIVADAAPAKPFTVEVKANLDWDASCPEVDATWCKLTKSGSELKITLEVNPTKTSRSTIITVIAKNDTQMVSDEIKITQAGSDDVLLVPSTDKVIFKADGSESKFKIVSNSKVFTYNDTIKWCKITLVGDEFTIVAEKNPGEGERSDTLVITAGGGDNITTAKVALVQYGQAPFLDLEPKEITMNMSGDAQTVKILTNLSNITVTNSSGNGAKGVLGEDNIVTVTADPHYDMSEKSGFIMISGSKTNDKGQLITQSTNIVVKWNPAPAVTLSADAESLVFTKDGGTKELTVTSNLLWSYTDVAGYEITRAGDKLSIKKSSTTSETDVTAKLILKAGGGNNLKTISVDLIQFGTKPSLKVSSDAVALTAAGDVQYVTVSCNREGWGFNKSAGADWCTVTKDGNKLAIRGTALTGGSRMATITVLVTADGQTIEVPITVTQNKNYAVGEYYVVDGKKVGIVFAVTDGGAHGKVVSLDAHGYYNGSTTPSHTYLYYHSNEGGLTGDDLDTWIKNAVNVVGTNISDGRQNMDALKATGVNWKNFYPAAAWCDNKNQTNDLGWYMPAYDEIAELYLWFSTVPVATPYTKGWYYNDVMPGKKREVYDYRDNINKLFTDAGGEKIDYEATAPESYMFSSTCKHAYNRCSVARLEMDLGMVDSWADLIGTNSSSTCMVRAIFRF